MTRSAVVEAERFLQELEGELRPAVVRRNLSWWASATEGTAEAAAEAAEAAWAVDAVIGRSLQRGQAVGWMDGLEEDSALRRSLELVRLEQLRCSGDAALRERIVRAEAELERRFHVHRGVDASGRAMSQAQIEAVLEASDDEEERRAAWEAALSVGVEVEGSVRALAEDRNVLARSLGYRDHFAFALARQELDEDWLLRLLGRIERDTREAFRAGKAQHDQRLAARFGVEVEALRPWHHADAFFQRSSGISGVRERVDTWLKGCPVEETCTRFFDGLGMDVRPVLSRSDLLPREGKSQHAFCLDIDRSGDVRILANVRPGLQWMSTMLHECGHAVYDRYGDPEVRWLLREPAHVLTTEAMAMWMGRQVMEPDFLMEYGEVTLDSLAGMTASLRREQSFEMLLFVRWVLVLVHFERALYESPGSVDLSGTWARLKERYQLQSYPDRMEHADWAAKIHVALAPVYYPNYLLGELLASQLRACLLAESEVHGLVDNLQVGQELIQRLFRPGRRWRWDELVRRVTGEPLDTRAFLREFAGRVGG